MAMLDRELPPEKVWPHFFPENCPPNDATEPCGEYWRIVKHDPPSPQDFEPLCIANPRRQYSDDLNDRYGASPRCLASGVSLLKTIEEARNVARAIPAKRTGMLAKGTLEPDMGRLKHTPTNKNKGHHTLWLWDGVDPSSSFTVVENLGSGD